MAVDLHTGDTNTSFPYHLLKGSPSKQQLLIPPKTPLPHSTEAQGNDMPHFMLQVQDHNKFHSSSIASHNFESPWDSMISSPQSTLSSPLGSNQGSHEGSSQEPWPNSHDSSYDMVRMLEKMKLDERGSFKHHPSYEIQSFDTSDVYQSLLHQQIQATQLWRLRQEKIQRMKQKLNEYRENQGHIYEQFQKKGKGVDVGCDNGRRTPPPWRTRSQSHHKTGSEMRPICLDTSGSRGTSCGTGVFLPRGGTSAQSEPRKRPGKGCSTVLIPPRVVQALQLHFDQMSATSGPKSGGFPPLHDVLVSNKDGMYSLQKRQSRKKMVHTRSEMVLPQEWTY